MHGDEKVIAALNAALKEELTAINQYFIHAEMCENWGYKKLSGYIKKQSIDEMKHAEALIERILFLDGAPKMAEPMSLKVGQSVKTQIESDLKLEIGAVAMYNASAKLAARSRRPRLPGFVRQTPEGRGRARGLAGGPARPNQRTGRRELPGAAVVGRMARARRESCPTLRPCRVSLPTCPASERLAVCAIRFGGAFWVSPGSPRRR